MGPGRQPRPAWEPERWVEDAPAKRQRSKPPAASEPPKPKTFLPPEAPRGRRPPRLPGEVGAELSSAAGPTRAPRLAARLADASRAYERDRYEDARRILKPLSEEAPGSAAVRELYGLTLYRMGRWRDAIKQLEAFHTLSGSYDQHPTMMDCHRALGRHAQVDSLWNDLGDASPSAELMTEGRIVRAGSLGDRGDLQGAIRLLDPSAKRVDRPREHHLRLWYALADLYERAGEMPAARDLFGLILRYDRGFFDAAERQTALG
ncbi:MAG: tetratricopeptide repeat protein [Acidimicrobiales bacterium]